MTDRSSRLARCVLAWALALALAWPGTSAAQSDEAARAAFDAGRHAYADADYELALAEFNRSYELSRKPELLYNIGMTLERLRRDREAIDAFERYLAEVPSAENHAVVSRRMKALKASVAAADAAARAKNAAPTPEEVARAQVARTEAKSAPVIQQPAPAEEESPPVYSTWWFWTSIGTVVAAGVVTGIVLAQPDERSGAPTTAIRL